MSTFAWFSTQVSRKGAKAQRARKKVFWSCATAIVAAAVALLADVGRAEIKSDPPKISWNAESGQAVLTNGQVELVVETKSGINARSLRDVKTGQVYADRDYAWNLGGTVGLPKMEAAPEISIRARTGAVRSSSRGVWARSASSRRLHAAGESSRASFWSRSRSAIRRIRRSKRPASICGFAKHLREGETWTADAGEVRFCPVPYRRETNGADAGVSVARSGRTRSRPSAAGCEPAEADADLGRRRLGVEQGLFVIPHRQVQPAGHGMVADGAGETRQGNRVCDSAGRASGSTVIPRERRGSSPASPIVSARRGFRRSTAIGSRPTTPIAVTSTAKGCGLPKTYDPPVQWNELYDNEYFGRVCGMGNELLCSRQAGLLPGVL